MLNLSAAGLAAIASRNVPMAVLIDLDFATPIHLCTSAVSLVVNGTTYTATAGIGKISAVQNTPSDIKQLQFTLSGVQQAMIELVLENPGIQGTPATVSVAILDPTLYQVTDVVPIWAGALDTMMLEDAETSDISVTAEHLGIDLNRPTPIYYSDSDQQSLFAGDLFFEYTSQQFDQQIVWPAAGYYRK